MAEHLNIRGMCHEIGHPGGHVMGRRGGPLALFTVLMAFVWSDTASAQNCNMICNQYFSAARSGYGGASLATIQRLYGACMRCRRAGNGNPQRHAKRCSKGFYVSVNRCIRIGDVRCGRENRTCPKDQKCIPGGCAPKDASACPSGKGRYCKAPLYLCGRARAQSEKWEPVFG